MMQTASSCLHLPILLATDGSASARHLQRLVYPIAQSLAAQSTLRHPLVILPIQPRAMRQSKAAVGHSNEQSDATEETDLNKLDSQIRADLPVGLKATFETSQGRPIASILRAIEQTQSGLVAVAGEVNGVQGRWFDGVATAIARDAPCHVLVDAPAEVRGNRHEPISQPWQRLLLVINGSGTMQQTLLAMTRQILAIGIQQVTVLCIQPPLNTRYLFGPFATPTPSWQLNQLLQAAQQDWSQRLMQQAIVALDHPHLEVITRVTGNPGNTICQIAAQQHADVILLGSDAYRLGNARRFWAASPDAPVAGKRLLVELPLRFNRLTATGNYVMHHSPCPILLCRSPNLPIGILDRSEAPPSLLPIDPEQLAPGIP